MARKTKNTDVVAASPLVATGVEKMILVIRDKQVLLDRDLATLYGVATKVLNQAVKRNAERFPERYCFQLRPQEYMFLRSQSGMRTNSWTQLEDASCTLLKNKSPRRWKHSMI